MAIELIDKETCTGCRICVNICPEDVIYMDNTKNIAYIKYPEDCVACFA